MLTSIIKTPAQGTPTEWNVALRYGDPLPGEALGQPRGALSGMVRLAPTAQGSGELLAPFGGKVDVHPPTPFGAKIDAHPQTGGFMSVRKAADYIAALDGASLTLYLVPTLDKVQEQFARMARAVAGRFLDADVLNADGDRAVDFIECLVLQGLDGVSVRAALPSQAVTIRNNASVQPAANAVWNNFLLGRNPLRMRAGMLLGKVLAGQACSVGLLTPVGLIDPRLLFAAAIDEGVVSAADLPGIRALLDLLPASPPAIAPGTAAAAIGADRIHRWPDLMEWRAGARPTSSEWRGIADRQKTQFLARLAQRARPGGTTPRFVFNDEDARNPLQLEAIAEFYLNFPEPDEPQATPLAPNAQGYRSLDFTDLFGRNAQAQGTTVTLDGGPRLARLVCGRDVLELDGESVRPWKQFRIMGVDVAANGVVVDKAPTLNGSSSWRILQDPALVLIDDGGTRVSGAVARRTAPNTLTLEGLNETEALGVERSNTRFDTVGLIDAPTGTRSDFRILDVTVTRTDGQPAQAVLTLDADPALQAASSRWDIPAGLGGRQAPIPWSRAAQFAPKKWYDQYDGRLFLVSGHSAPIVLPWTSLTSRKQATQYLSSLDGNRHYRVTSALTGKHNTTFKVMDAEAMPRGNSAVSAGAQSPTGIDLDNRSLRETDYHSDNGWMMYLLSATPPRKKSLPLIIPNHEADLPLGRVHINLKNKAARPATPTPYWLEMYDGVRHAAFYFGEQVTPDDAQPDPPTANNTLGKFGIRMHLGGIVGTGSQGCLVSPWYWSFRNAMTALHERRNRTYYAENRDADLITWVNRTTNDPPPVVEEFLLAKKKLDELVDLLKRLGALVRASTRGPGGPSGDQLAATLEKLFSLSVDIKLRQTVNAKHGDAATSDSLSELIDKLAELLEAVPVEGLNKKRTSALTDQIGSLSGLNAELANAYAAVNAEDERVGWTHALQSDLYLIRPHERRIG